MPRTETPDLLLLPRPRSVVRNPGWVDVPRAPFAVRGADAPLLDATLGLVIPRAVPADADPSAWAACELDPAFAAGTPNADQAYELHIYSGAHLPGTLAAPAAPVRIVARTRTGLRYALHTLAQLLRRFPDRLPALTITDAPAFATRGVMLDVSRDRVPTMTELFSTVDLLASLKFNHLQLYTEHTFAYAGHEEVWEGWSPVTPDEVRLLDAHCRDRGIALAANQNCFGHLASWLKLPRYAPLAEIQREHWNWSFYEWPRAGPFSLCPLDPGSIALVDDLLSQLLPCFSTPLVNIGCDETADVGQGRSRDDVARLGKARVYFDFVSQVAAAACRHGFKPMFWADIALSHPDHVGRIPEDMIALAWGYEPDAPFTEWCARLRDAGREAWVCPGTSSWRSITGRTAERRGNLRRAAREGVGNGATGFLVTDWGDTGHHQQWPIALHAIAEAADAAWRGAGCQRGDGWCDGDDGGFDARASSLHAFGDPSLHVAPWLDELGDVDRHLRLTAGRSAPDGAPTPLRNSSVLFSDFHGTLPPGGRSGTGTQWRSMLDRLSDLAARRPGGLSPLITAELDHTLAAAALAADAGAARRGDHGALARIGPELASKLRALIGDHRRLWPARSRPGGLDHSCEFYNKVLATLL